MSKYIDAEKLKAEIERLYNGEAPKHNQQCNFDDGYFMGIDTISQLIDSLQQEQPEVDLEKEIDRVFFQQDCGSDRLYYNEIANIARHFAEWGAIHLNAKKEE